MPALSKVTNEQMELAMFRTMMLIAPAGLLLMPLATGAQQAPRPQEPYTARVGDKQVTSVKREATRDVGLSREELLRAAREALPTKVVPIDPASGRDSPR
jgi:hypothetical protein